MAATPEDKRVAVTLSTTLSGQLVQAAVTMLTVEGAYIAYALTSREVEELFYCFAFISALFFIVSVFVSGKGITLARNSGFDGNWSLSAGKRYFNFQAVCLILGLIFLAAMLWLSGTEKSSIVQEELIKQNSKIQNIEIRQSELEAEITVALDRIEEQVDDIENKILSDQDKSNQNVTNPSN